MGKSQVTPDDKALEIGTGQSATKIGIGECVRRGVGLHIAIGQADVPVQKLFERRGTKGKPNVVAHIAAGITGAVVVVLRAGQNSGTLAFDGSTVKGEIVDE